MNSIALKQGEDVKSKSFSKLTKINLKDYSRDILCITCFKKNYHVLDSMVSKMKYFQVNVVSDVTKTRTVLVQPFVVSKLIPSYRFMLALYHTNLYPKRTTRTFWRLKQMSLIGLNASIVWMIDWHKSLFFNIHNCNNYIFLKPLKVLQICGWWRPCSLPLLMKHS